MLYKLLDYFCDAMYYLLFAHSVLRWLVLITLLWAVFTTWEGRFFKRPYKKSDRIAISAASVSAHVQLLVGFALYYWSPVAQGFWQDHPVGWNDSKFFGLVHFGLMTVAIILITVGSALAKRDMDDQQKFKVVFNYYFIALLIILIAIPWPFSPLAQRPFIRDF